MPNHITTIIRANDAVIDAMFRPVTDLERKTFEKNEQQATEYAAQQGYPRIPQECPTEVLTFDLLIPQPPNIEVGGCNNQHEEGVVCWYHWNIEHWGTKWDAYSVERVDTDIVSFDTAWAHPYPVLEALSMKFPDHVLEVAYADEDLGGNMGVYRMLNGVAYHLGIPEDYSKDAVDLASLIKYGWRYSERYDEDGNEREGEPAQMGPAELFTSMVAGNLIEAKKDG